jgi:glycosyltransferase involved in cell wall biosynthesis
MAARENRSGPDTGYRWLTSPRRNRSESVRNALPLTLIATLSKVGGEPSDSSCDVLLPCLDEAAALPWVLSRMPAGFRPIVVDNGSRDGSPEIAAALRATVIRAERRGYGAACHAGLLAATAPIVAVMDADASLDPHQLPDLVAPLLRDQADLVPLLCLDLQDRRSGYPVETVVRAADAGWRVVAVDVDYLKRRGHSKVTGTPIGAWRAVRDMTAVMTR